MLTTEKFEAFVKLAYDATKPMKKIAAALAALERDLGGAPQECWETLTDVQSASLGSDRKTFDLNVHEFIKAIAEWRNPGARDRIEWGAAGGNALSVAERAFADATPGFAVPLAPEFRPKLSPGPMDRHSWSAGENHVPMLQRQRGWHVELRDLRRTYNAWLSKSRPAAALFSDLLAMPVEQLDSGLVERAKNILHAALTEHRGWGLPSREYQGVQGCAV